VRWSAKTGKGDVVQRLPGGDLLRTCFHVGYAGYTGGLVIGAYNGSGLGFYPKKPIRGFRRINVLCAQDESILDRASGKELTYGWSENLGTGPDGERLEYVRGRILERGPRRVVLQSENAGGCYRVTKVATARRGTRYWIIATRVTNRCDKPVRFDLFSGDDPWLGLYRSSDGDVGWSAERGILRNEAAFGPGRFTAGGLYDLGNRALGQKEGGFSGQANFFAVDPAVPLPDLTLLANRFAHAASEVDPKRALDNKSITALNLGWIDRSLPPGRGFTFALAMGLARTDPRRPGALPRLPDITPADWSVWRRYLSEGGGGQGVEFAAERMELDLSPDRLRVRGTYWLRNRSADSVTLGIHYPILSDADRPPPDHVEVDGEQVPVSRTEGTAHPGARFPVRVPPRGLARFVVRYTQRHTGNRAGYMVTSARRWPVPLTRAVFLVRHPASMGRVRLSYRPDQVRRLDGGETVELLVVRQPFSPKREIELRWGRRR
jgi:hypothetical protein